MFLSFVFGRQHDATREMPDHMYSTTILSSMHTPALWFILLVSTLRRISGLTHVAHLSASCHVCPL